jgi:hypothetical protein
MRCPCFTLILVLALLNASMASPIILKNSRHLNDKSDKPAITLYQNSNDFLNDKFAHKIPDEQPLSETPFEPNFQIFAMYDKRGPWKLSFLPQPPPQTKAPTKVAANEDLAGNSNAKTRNIFW